MLFTSLLKNHNCLVLLNMLKKRFKRRAMKGQIGEEEYESSGVCSPCKSGRLRFWGKERLNLCASLESEF